MKSAAPVHNLHRSTPSTSASCFGIMIVNNRAARAFISLGSGSMNCDAAPIWPPSRNEPCWNKQGRGLTLNNLDYGPEKESWNDNFATVGGGATCSVSARPASADCP